MPDIHSLFLFGHEFDEFLYAPIGEEKNGMVLSVMSALARRNVDPWQEAARLSRLPRDVATRELCAMIAELPPSAPNRASPRSIAERLIAPLPMSAGSGGSSRRTGPERVALSRGETVRGAVVLFFLLIMMAVAAIGQQSASVEHVPMSSAGGSSAIIQGAR